MSCLHVYEHPMFCALFKPPEEPFLFILHILSSCLKKILLIDSLCSPSGPTFGCSISKAPPFRLCPLWLNLLHSA
jgi:hypothetical protein